MIDRWSRGRLRLVLAPSPSALVALVLHAPWFRDLEAWSAQPLAGRHSGGTSHIDSSAVVLFGLGTPGARGLRITPECSALALVLPIVAVAAFLVGFGRRFSVTRVLVAGLGTCTVILTVNTIRIALIAAATQRWGIRGLRGQPPLRRVAREPDRVQPRAHRRLQDPHERRRRHPPDPRRHPVSRSTARAPRGWRRGAGVLGRLLVYAALATVLMVAYLVFGTARIEARGAAHCSAPASPRARSSPRRRRSRAPRPSRGPPRRPHPPAHPRVRPSRSGRRRTAGGGGFSRGSVADPFARARSDRGGGGGHGRAPAGAWSLPGDLATWRAGQRRHRRASNHLRRPLRGRPPAPSLGSDHPRHRRRPIDRLRGDRHRDRLPRRGERPRRHGR